MALSRQHHGRPGLDLGLLRASTFFVCGVSAKEDVDGRNKSGHDAEIAIDRHCEKRSDEAIQGRPTQSSEQATLDCFASLAMTMIIISLHAFARCA